MKFGIRFFLFLIFICTFFFYVKINLLASIFLLSVIPFIYMFFISPRKVKIELFLITPFIVSLIIYLSIISTLFTNTEFLKFLEISKPKIFNYIKSLILINFKKSFTEITTKELILIESIAYQVYTSIPLFFPSLILLTLGFIFKVIARKNIDFFSFEIKKRVVLLFVIASIAINYFSSPFYILIFKNFASYFEFLVFLNGYISVVHLFNFNNLTLQLVSFIICLPLYKFVIIIGIIDIFFNLRENKEKI